MKQIIEKMNDGGPAITYVIFILLIVILAMLIKALVVDKGDNPKLKSLIASVAWFALAWGYVGRTFGLIKAFDTVAASGAIEPWMLAPGLKMALVGPLAGLFTFVIARLGIIGMTILEKKKAE